MEDKIFSVKNKDFDALALEVFYFQYAGNPVYQSWVNTIGINPNNVTRVEQIPFLPIGFFKTHTVATTLFTPESIFESSGTTGSINSKHFIKSLRLYEQSFMKAFELSYGNPEDYVI